MKEVYICHQYLDKSHFLALYKCAEENGYLIKDYIVLGKKHIINRMGKQILYEHKFFSAIRECVCSLNKIHEFKKLRDKTIIVGLAPYDYRMNKYADVFKRNRSVYFTSWQFWDGSNFPMGDLKNKAAFEEILRTSFTAAACVSKVTECQVKEFIPKTAVVNHSIPVSEYQTKDEQDMGGHRYLFLGRLAPAKNLNYILDYLRQNPEDNIEIDIAGQGKLLEDVQNLENEDGRLHYLGKLSKDEIKADLHKYKYLILPSKEEPFGIVLLEALAAGVPSIVSNALGPDEIIDNEKTGIKFSLADGYKGFETAMKKSQQLSECEYKKMVQNCLLESQKYSEKAIFKKWKTIL